ncbi:MAG: AarF/UbiB family protein, partial [Gammaproteobacteria bacterium]|nr:AarF/UbiB family protein [Gammaproteobacteria bacterium]
MIRVRQALRLVHINAVLIKHRLDELAFATHVLRPVSFLLYLLPWNWFRGRPQPRAIRIRQALEDLGPIFVKFGQILSTRPDLLPEDIAEELASLQDRVPPFPGAVARRIVERELKRKLDELFSEFSEEPIASASIAQVHAARLKDGTEVVVKVVRPGIEQLILRDVGLLYLLAGLAERYWRHGRRLRPKEVVAEYEKTILDELD